MESDDKKQKYPIRGDINHVWDRIEKEGDKIEEIFRTQASAEAKLNNLEHTVELGFRNLGNLISNLSDKVHKPPDPTNWIGIGSLIVAAMLMGGSWIQTRLSPIEHNSEIFQKMFLESLGSSAQTTESLRWIEKIVDEERQRQPTNSKLEYLEDRLSSLESRPTREQEND